MEIVGAYRVRPGVDGDVTAGLDELGELIRAKETGRSWSDRGSACSKRAVKLDSLGLDV